MPGPGFLKMPFSDFKAVDWERKTILHRRTLQILGDTPYGLMSRPNDWFSVRNALGVVDRDSEEVDV